MDVVLLGSLLPGIENHSLALLRRAVEARGYSAELAPLSGLSQLSAALDTVLRLQPRLCGLSMQSTESALINLCFTRLLRQRGYSGRIVCGGHFATLNAEDLLRANAGIDYVVQFAGEQALVALLGPDPVLEQVAGLMFVDANGDLRRGASATRVDPERLLGLERSLPEHLGFPSADLVLSHGCEARCGYCCVAAMSELESHLSADLPRARTERAPYYFRAEPSAIAQHIGMLYHEHGARVFNFMDDNLLPLSPEAALAWLGELECGLQQQGVARIAFSLQLRSDVVTEPVARRLVELGLVRAYLGIDATTPSQLRALGRRAPPDAGRLALHRLSELGVFCTCNSLLIGPTIPFESVREEVRGLAELDYGPLHLLPLDVRTGTALFRRARDRGLVEGSFVWRKHRFEDARTERVAELLLALPTRLQQRSVPIGLYDLGYNLGVARRLVPAVRPVVDELERSYRRIARAWNRDQIRVLQRAITLAETDDREAMQRAIAEERQRVTAHDQGLLLQADLALTRLEREVSRSRRRPVVAHARGKLIGAALSYSLAACASDPASEVDRATTGGSGGAGSVGGASPAAGGGDAFAGSVSAAGSASDDVGFDLGTGACPDGRQSASSLSFRNTCAASCTVELEFDAQGVVTAVQAIAINGEELDAGLDAASVPEGFADCVRALLEPFCYPSLASSRATIDCHSWIA